MTKVPVAGLLLAVGCLAAAVCTASSPAPISPSSSPAPASQAAAPSAKPEVPSAPPAVSGAPAAMASAPGRGWLRGDAGKLPNVVLITIDTLRGDHVGHLSEVARGLTPSIDRFATSGTAFLQASTPAPSTRPALTSLLTGRYPGGHPVMSNFGSLPPGVPVLAEILKAAGFATAAFYGNLAIENRSGLARGFDRYEPFVRMWQPLDDARGTAAAREWLASAPPSPWFLWVHFMSPHGAYNTAPEKLWKDLPDSDALPDEELPVSASNYGLNVLPRYQVIGKERRASTYRRRYRGEIRYVDEQVGALLEALSAAGQRDPTLVVLSADHGESLGEHDYFFQHGFHPYESSLRVPLVMSLPGTIPAGIRVDASVSLVDVVPTLLAGLDVAAPLGLEGRDLSPALRGETLEDAAVFSVTALSNQMSSVRRGSWKLVHTPPPPAEVAKPNDPWAGAIPRVESYALYDLSSDPGETRDVSTQHPERVQALKDELTAWENAHDIPRGLRERPPQVDSETHERLRALGYAD